MSISNFCLKTRKKISKYKQKLFEVFNNFLVCKRVLRSDSLGTARLNHQVKDVLNHQASSLSRADSRSPFIQHPHVQFPRMGTLVLFSGSERSNVCTHFPGASKRPPTERHRQWRRPPWSVGDLGRGRARAWETHAAPGRRGFPPGTREAAPGPRR